MDDGKDVPEWFGKPILIMGCGNPLLGDDGFGPAVVEALRERGVPANVYILNAGSSAREILFPMVVGDTRVERLIIVDAVDLRNRGRVPGEVFEMPVDDLPLVKVDDFSMHQIPSSNLLRDLRDHHKVKVIVLACQIGSIPDYVAPGLSEPVRNAVERMCDMVSGYWR